MYTSPFPLERVCPPEALNRKQPQYTEQVIKNCISECDLQFLITLAIMYCVRPAGRAALQEDIRAENLTRAVRGIQYVYL